MREKATAVIRRLRERNRRLRRRARLWRVAALVFAAAFAVVFAGFARQALEDAAAPRASVDTVTLGTGIAGIRAAASTPESQPAQGPLGTADTAGEVVAQRTGEIVGEGQASYYAESFEGRRTASGEAYRGRKLTAAHRTLPLGTHLKVTNLANDRSVVVEVNDRGPFHGRRAIDLSRAAAAQLRMLDAGRAQVSIELLPSR